MKTIGLSKSPIQWFFFLRAPRIVDGQPFFLKVNFYAASSLTIGFFSMSSSNERFEARLMIIGAKNVTFRQLQYRLLSYSNLKIYKLKTHSLVRLIINFFFMDIENCVSSDNCLVSIFECRPNEILKLWRLRSSK